MRRKKSTYVEFFKDSRGSFSVFTVISLLAGITLVTAPLVTRLLGWDTLSREELTTLTLIYSISALSDYLLAIMINRMPGVLSVNQSEEMTISQQSEIVENNQLPRVE